MISEHRRDTKEGIDVTDYNESPQKYVAPNVYSKVIAQRGAQTPQVS
jgi:hypothetical protein